MDVIELYCQCLNRKTWTKTKKITHISCLIQPTLHLRMRNTPPSTRAASSSPPTHQNIVAAGVPPQAPGS